MRIFVLVAFIGYAIGGLLALVGLAYLEDGRWTNFFKVIEAICFGAWASWLLWR